MLQPEIIGVFIPIVTIIAIAFIVKIISDNRTRRIAIEKGMLNENIKYLYYDRFEGHVPSSLKWGVVLVAIGLAIFIGQLLPARLTDEVTLGLMFTFAGVGLIIYYFVARKIVEKTKK